MIWLNYVLDKGQTAVTQPLPFPFLFPSLSPCSNAVPPSSFAHSISLTIRLFSLKLASHPQLINGGTGGFTEKSCAQVSNIVELRGETFYRKICDVKLNFTNITTSRFFFVGKFALFVTSHNSTRFKHSIVLKHEKYLLLTNLSVYCLLSLADWLLTTFVDPAITSSSSSSPLHNINLLVSRGISLSF